MSWSRPLVTQEEHAHLQRPIYLLSQWQRCFSVAALMQPSAEPEKKAESMSCCRFHFRTNLSSASQPFFLLVLFQFGVFFYPRPFKRQTFGRFVSRKFLSVLIKLGGSRHTGQTEPSTAEALFHLWAAPLFFISLIRSEVQRVMQIHQNLESCSEGLGL